MNRKTRFQIVGLLACFTSAACAADWNSVNAPTLVVAASADNGTQTANGGVVNVGPHRSYSYTVTPNSGEVGAEAEVGIEDGILNYGDMAFASAYTIQEPQGFGETTDVTCTAQAGFTNGAIHQGWLGLAVVEVGNGTNAPY